MFAFALLLTTAIVLGSPFAASATSQYANLSSVESDIVSRINGTSIYNYDLQLENTALNHTLSFYSFLSSGSVGANEAAAWIQEQFDSFGGLQTQMEPFNFTTWNLLTQPTLTIDADGNLNTTADQVAIKSFQSAHYSWPTPENGTFASVVTLPLPYAATERTAEIANYDAAAWNAVNTTGKVLLIGAEVQWNPYTYLVFKNKLLNQPPAAIIFTWSYDWMAWAPPTFNPSGGRPASRWGPYFWNLKTPAGWVSYEDGQTILNQMNTHTISAFILIRAVIGMGLHYNVVAKLPGSVNPEKEIIISAHYDSVMDAAFCDNGAGTAAVLELAKTFSEAARTGAYKPQDTLVFIAFAGEELGLVGSVNYVKQHASELGNVAAIINLDSIGSQTLEISKTFPDDNGLDLQSIVTNAANNLGVPLRLINPGGSDQETFRNPVETDDSYSLLWGSASGIRNATRVKSSIMIDSYPLYISDAWDGGQPGWVHTSYDNSSSTAALDWVTVDALQNQTRVAGLSVMRVLSTINSPFLLEVYVSAAIAAAVVAVAAYVERSRLTILLRRLSNEVRAHMGMKELLYIIGLTAILFFISFALYSSTGEIEITDNGYPLIVAVQYFGTPLKMFGVLSGEPGQLPAQTASSHYAHDYSTLPSLWEPTQTGGINVLWPGLIINGTLFLLTAFLITYAVTKLKHTRDYYKT